MPVVFTPYLKDRLGIENADKPKRKRKAPEPEAVDEPAQDDDDPLLTRRSFIVGAAAIASGAAVIALARRELSGEESEDPIPDQP